MTALDSIPLPHWALNSCARALLKQLISSPPETKIVDACGFKYETYRSHGCPAYVKLKQMHEAWLAYEQAELDAKYHAGHGYDQTASNALYRVEDADKLVRRVLAEAALQERVQAELRFTMKMQERDAA